MDVGCHTCECGQPCLGCLLTESSASHKERQNKSPSLCTEYVCIFENTGSRLSLKPSAALSVSSYMTTLPCHCEQSRISCIILLLDVGWF